MVAQNRRFVKEKKKKKKIINRGHPGLNQGPLDLQSNALPLSYTPNADQDMYKFM